MRLWHGLKQEKMRGEKDHGPPSVISIYLFFQSNISKRSKAPYFQNGSWLVSLNEVMHRFTMYALRTFVLLCLSLFPSFLRTLQLLFQKNKCWKYRNIIFRIIRLWGCSNTAGKNWSLQKFRLFPWTEGFSYSSEHSFPRNKNRVCLLTVSEN